VIEIGKMNALAVAHQSEFGLYLDGENLGEILLPNRYGAKDYKLGDFIDVFVYLDSEDRLVATSEKPLAMVGEFAYLKVIAVNRFGAFLNWGLPKDLLVPFREQKSKMEKGRSYIVHIYLDDKTNRIVASSKVERFLNKTQVKYKSGEEVSLLISNKTDLGFNAIINNRHSGILYENETFKSIKTGQKIKGYIKKVREDQKIDLVLQKPGYYEVDRLSEMIIDELKKNNGYLKISDKSPAEKIKKVFGISKKTYKKAIGALYKKRQIFIDEEGIRLMK
jgi:predicted RNA-binding protein (virulence factor B family)